MIGSHTDDDAGHLLMPIYADVDVDGHILANSFLGYQDGQTYTDRLFPLKILDGRCIGRF